MTLTMVLIVVRFVSRSLCLHPVTDVVGSGLRSSTRAMARKHMGSLGIAVNHVAGATWVCRRLPEFFDMKTDNSPRFLPKSVQKA